MKRCPKCEVSKPLKEFNRDRSRKDGHFPWCRLCHKAHTDRYRKRIGKEEVNRRQAAFRRKRDANKRARDLHLKNSQLYVAKHRYGVTATFLANLAEHQEGVCAICGETPSGKRPLCIDHDHQDGEVRGLLCDGCNIGLGCFKDDSQLLKKAMAYLKSPPAQAVS